MSQAPGQPDMKTFEIDGRKISTIQEFLAETGRAVFGDPLWVSNLNGLDDALYGGMGTPDDGFELVWIEHEQSKARLAADFDLLIEIFEAHSAPGAEHRVILSLR